MTEVEQFIAEQGNQFHIKMLMYYGSIASQEERDNQKDDDVLMFDFPFGTFSITYGELNQKALEEVKNMQDESKQ